MVPMAKRWGILRRLFRVTHKILQILSLLAFAFTRVFSGLPTFASLYISHQQATYMYELVKIHVRIASHLGGGTYCLHFL